MLFLKSSTKCVCSRPFLAMSSALVMMAGMLFGANIATADSVWVQSYERTSQTQACAAQPGETPWQASWGTDSSWSPSWEQWANKGMGGWVCTRSITWARTPVAASGGGSVTYRVGDIGPGNGLVFLISGGLTYEMAPKAWSGSLTPDAVGGWCNVNSDVTGAVGIAVGTGNANTTAIDAACTSGAGQSASNYSFNGLSDWFLPSKDELNAMYTYSQVAGFDTVTYGFASADYWSSSQTAINGALAQQFNGGFQSNNSKGNSLRVRPIRAF